MYHMKMRTISAAIEEIKAADPQSCVTEHYVRSLILEGRIPYCKAGKKYLIDLITLELYLKGMGGDYDGE